MHSHQQTTHATTTSTNATSLSSQGLQPMPFSQSSMPPANATLHPLPTTQPLVFGLPYPPNVELQQEQIVQANIRFKQASDALEGYDPEFLQKILSEINVLPMPNTAIMPNPFRKKIKHGNPDLFIKELQRILNCKAPNIINSFNHQIVGQDASIFYDPTRLLKKVMELYRYPQFPSSTWWDEHSFDKEKYLKIIAELKYERTQPHNAIYTICYYAANALLLIKVCNIKATHDPFFEFIKFKYPETIRPNRLRANKDRACRFNENSRDYICRFMNVPGQPKPGVDKTKKSSYTLYVPGNVQVFNPERGNKHTRFCLLAKVALSLIDPRFVFPINAMTDDGWWLKNINNQPNNFFPVTKFEDLQRICLAGLGNQLLPHNEILIKMPKEQLVGFGIFSDDPCQCVDAWFIYEYYASLTANNSHEFLPCILSNDDMPIRLSLELLALFVEEMLKFISQQISNNPECFKDPKFLNCYNSIVNFYGLCDTAKNIEYFGTFKNQSWNRFDFDNLTFDAQSQQNKDFINQTEREIVSNNNDDHQYLQYCSQVKSFIDDESSKDKLQFIFKKICELNIGFEGFIIKADVMKNIKCVLHGLSKILSGENLTRYIYNFFLKYQKIMFNPNQTENSESTCSNKDIMNYLFNVLVFLTKIKPLSQKIYELIIMLLIYTTPIQTEYGIDYELVYDFVNIEIIFSWYFKETLHSFNGDFLSNEVNRFLLHAFADTNTESGNLFMLYRLLTFILLPKQGEKLDFRLVFKDDLLNKIKQKCDAYQQTEQDQDFTILNIVNLVQKVCEHFIIEQQVEVDVQEFEVEMAASSLQATR